MFQFVAFYHFRGRMHWCRVVQSATLSRFDIRFFESNSVFGYLTAAPRFHCDIDNTTMHEFNNNHRKIARKAESESTGAKCRVTASRTARCACGQMHRFNSQRLIRSAKSTVPIRCYRRHDEHRPTPRSQRTLPKSSFERTIRFGEKQLIRNNY